VYSALPKLEKIDFFVLTGVDRGNIGDCRGDMKGDCYLFFMYHRDGILIRFTPRMPLKLLSSSVARGLIRMERIDG